MNNKKICTEFVSMLFTEGAYLALVNPP